MSRCSTALARAALLSAVAACSGPAGSSADAGLPDTVGNLDAPLGYRIEPIETRPFTLGTRSWTIHLVRILRPDGGHTYVEWIPADKPGPRPVVVVTAPYASTEWSGEAVDARWAGYSALPDGSFLDRDGPGFEGTAEIVYDRLTPEDVATQATPHLYNDLGALVVFGRYHAGGSVRDDVADMAAGMWFAAEQPEVDRARVGVWGGSWGGFEALYAAQGADPRARPRVVSALYPPSDFATWIPHALTRSGPALDRLAPYVRRIYASTGGPPSAPGADYHGLHATDLCAGLPADTLVLHDDHDNLVPVSQTHDLVAACQVTPLYWPRQGPADPALVGHGPIGEGALPAAGLYSLAFVHRRLATADAQFVLEFYQPSSLVDHLSAVHAAQALGRDVSDVAPRLRELIDPLIFLSDLATCATGCVTEPGTAVVARVVNQVWSTHYTAATITAALATGLPPP